MKIDRGGLMCAVCVNTWGTKGMHPPIHHARKCFTTLNIEYSKVVH